MSSLLRACRSWIRRRSTGREAAAWRRAHVGASSYIDCSVQVLGWKQVRVGHHSVISEGSWLNINDREVDAPVIVIGNNCYIGRRNFLSAGAAIRIGDYCFTGVNCNFLGSDHVYTSPFAPYVTTGTTTDTTIEIGPNCWLGAAVSVLKGVKIGYGSIVGAASVVTRDVPAFSVVVGNPARLVRRYDVQRQAWVDAADYPASADAALPGEEAYLEALRNSHPALKIPLIASARKFGDI
jgi:acetyltransferase-like isoleucine patch superfamily enzyme